MVWIGKEGKMPSLKSNFRIPDIQLTFVDLFTTLIFLFLQEACYNLKKK